MTDPANATLQAPAAQDVNPCSAVIYWTPTNPARYPLSQRAHPTIPSVAVSAYRITRSIPVKAGALGVQWKNRNREHARMRRVIRHTLLGVANHLRLGSGDRDRHWSSSIRWSMEA